MSVGDAAILLREAGIRLLKKGLYLDERELAVICVECGFALQPNKDRVGRHLGEKHDIPKRGRIGINQLVERLELPDPDTLPQLADRQPAHRYLALQDGILCKGCGFRSTSFEVMARHVRQQHKDAVRPGPRGGWIRDVIEEGVKLQSWLLGDVRRAWVVLPATVSQDSQGQRQLPIPISTKEIAVRSQADLIIAAEKEYFSQTVSPRSSNDSRRLPQPTSQSSPNMLTNWMRRTGWERIFAHADCVALSTAATLPFAVGLGLEIIEYQGLPLRSSIDDEQRLQGMMAAVDRMFDRCHQTVEHTDTAIRRWLRGRFPEQPFKAPFELVAHERSEKQYRRLFKRCICMWLRLWRLPTRAAKKTLGRPISRSQSAALAMLWNDTSWQQEEASASGSANSSDDEDGSYARKGQHRGAVNGSRGWRERRRSRRGSPLESQRQGKEETASVAASAEDTDSDGNEDDAMLDSDYYDSDSSASSVVSSQRLAAMGDGDIDGESEDEDEAEETRGRAVDVVKQDRQADVLLRFCYFLATEDFNDGQALSTLLIYFSAVCGLEGEHATSFKRPAQYTTYLSGLIYCVRLVLLEYTLPYGDHDYISIPARSRNGQLETLQAIRKEKMCDGCMAPLGELLSLVAYGVSLYRSEGPKFLFEWSDDGQTVSWDNSVAVSMDAFRSLLSTTIDGLQHQLQLLMYHWLPALPDLSGLRDRISQSESGYSFVYDERNGLAEAYIQLLEKACTAPIDGLLKAGGAGKQGWDVPAVYRWLDRHDSLVRSLMLAFYLGGGMSPRVSELLTLEYRNSMSRLRGVCLYNGRVCYITRHQKTRRSTNNEFQVARFLPESVGRIVFYYLVYIRPLATMLQRACFKRQPSGYVLFTSTNTRGAWSSNTLSTELSRLSRSIPHLSIAINAQIYRQLSVAIADHHITGGAASFDRADESTASQNDAIGFAWQSGHRPRQRYSTYGLDGAFPDKLQPALLRIYLDVSKKWHAFLKKDNADAPTPIDLPPTDSAPPAPPLQPLPQKRSAIDLYDSEVEEAERQMRELKRAKATQKACIAPTNPEVCIPGTVRRKYTVVDPFIYLPERNVAACFFCKVAVFTNYVETHMSSGCHNGQFTIKERRAAQSLLSSIPGILRKKEDWVNYKLPSRESPVIPFIHPPRTDGYVCTVCGRAEANSCSMRRHCKKEHSWNGYWHNQTGFAKQRAPEAILWYENIAVQQLMQVGVGSRWFEVQNSLLDL